MRLLRLQGPGEFRLTDDLSDDSIPPYAILSHTWGSEEVIFEELSEGTGKTKAGFSKIEFCGKQAFQDGLQHFWVDTCCIKKSSDAEVTRAINSMFRWYQAAAKCYVYLSDVSAKRDDGQRSLSTSTWLPAFAGSKWFTRGWTLQELLAPASVEFFSKEGIRLGDKISLRESIGAITGIPLPALQGHLDRCSIRQRVSWVHNRTTKEKEDKVYCLLGLCGVFMPVLYSEGEGNALRRLRQEVASARKPQVEKKWSKLQKERVMDDRCRNCGELGHWESDCFPRKCGKCEIPLKAYENIHLRRLIRSRTRAHCKLLLGESTLLEL